jgi:hypothetical protein
LYAGDDWKTAGGDGVNRVNWVEVDGLDGRLDGADDGKENGECQLLEGYGE